MFQILETATLLRLLDAAPEAVHHTIEMGQWTGCVWPGHPEWEAHEACIQIRSLAFALFYGASSGGRCPSLRACRSTPGEPGLSPGW